MLFIVAAIIVLLHFLFHPVRLFGMDTSIFYMDEKITLTAWFTTVVYFFAAAIAFLSPRNLPRIGMGIFFLLLSLDEYFEIHEYINTLLKTIVAKETLAGSLFHFSWIFPFTILIAAIFFSFFLTAKREPNKRLKKLLLIGLSMYGAILVMELVGGLTYGLPIYVVMVGVEEGLEMFSAVIFLRYMLQSSKLFTA